MRVKGFRVFGFRVYVWGLVPGFEGFFFLGGGSGEGFKVQGNGSGSKVSGLRFRVSGLVVIGSRLKD